MLPRIVRCLSLLGFVLVASRAGAQIPSVPEPTCVKAFCPSSSKHPNREISCDDSGECSCWDRCDGSSGSSSSRSSSSRSSDGGLITAAIVGAAKVVVLVAAPGHAIEAFSRGPKTSAAEAAQQFRAETSRREALARHGRDLAAEKAAWFAFSRAVEMREENPHRHLLPLFEKTPLGPRMNVKDPLQQLRCVNQAMQSAFAAATAGVPGDISFLDARRAVDIAAGAFSSGLSPAECSGETLRTTAARISEEERRKLLSTLRASMVSMAKQQLQVREEKAQLQVATQKAQEAQQVFAAEQRKKVENVERAVEDARKEADEKRQAVEVQRQEEPPPSSPRHREKPPSDLMQRLLRAKASADAQVDELSQKLEQTKKDIESTTQEYETAAALALQGKKDNLAKAEQSLRMTNDDTNKVLHELGMEPLPP